MRQFVINFIAMEKLKDMKQLEESLTIHDWAHIFRKRWAKTGTGLNGESCLQWSKKWCTFSRLRGARVADSMGKER